MILFWIAEIDRFKGCYAIVGIITNYGPRPIFNLA